MAEQDKQTWQLIRKQQQIYEQNIACTWIEYKLRIDDINIYKLQRPTLSKIIRKQQRQQTKNKQTNKQQRDSHQ